MYWIRSECTCVSQVAVLTAGSALCYLRHLKPNPDVIVVLLVLKCEVPNYSTQNYQSIRASLSIVRCKWPKGHSVFNDQGTAEPRGFQEPHSTDEWGTGSAGKYSSGH